MQLSKCVVGAAFLLAANTTSADIRPICNAGAGPDVIYNTSDAVAQSGVCFSAHVGDIDDSPDAQLGPVEVATLDANGTLRWQCCKAMRSP